MTLYTDSTFQPIYQGQGYTAPDGTKYPSDFPLKDIEGLKVVNEVPQPTDTSLIVTGFIIDENYNQVWQARSKTADEIIASKPPIPNVTPSQARIALLQNGLLDTVTALITTPEQQIWWEYATIIERDNPMLNAIGAQLGLTSDQIDNLFKLAATIKS